MARYMLGLARDTPDRIKNVTIATHLVFVVFLVECDLFKKL